MAARRSFSTALKRTALYDYHVKTLKAKMVPFAGYEMPVEYKDVTGGVLKEHLQCRHHAALFDVSHMGQLKIHGRDRKEFINHLTVADMNLVPLNSAVLSLIMMEHGGIKDDTIITNFENHIGMVINAGCKDKDLEYLEHFQREFSGRGKDVTIEHLVDYGLVALQGPEAANIITKYVNVDLSKLRFMQAVQTQLHFNQSSIDALVTRCGYTGEDGFEISVHPAQVTNFVDWLLTHEPSLKPSGLGARDSLRLEAGMCLYGHDLEENITPIEASLLWTIPKTKRSDTTWIGAQTVHKQIAQGTEKKRVGFVIESGPSAREGTDVYLGENKIGTVSSGTFSPILKKAIGMAYIQSEFVKSKVGDQPSVKIRNKNVNITIAKMPFVETKYYK